MSKQVRTLLALSAILLLSLGSDGCGANSDEVLARVGGSAITKSTFEHWMSVARVMSPAEAQALLPADSGETTLKQRVLNFLIASGRTEVEAQEAGIAVADAPVKAELVRLRYEQSQGLSLGGPSQPLSFRFTTGETTSDRLWIIKVNMLSEKVKQHLTTAAAQQIPGASIARYYARHKSDFVIPERRDVAVIQSFTKENADLARREILAGQSLFSVVERRNDEVNVGGFRRGLSRRDLRHNYENNYFKARPHVLVGPLKEELYYLFEVTAVMPARQQRLSEVQASIRLTLVAGAKRSLLTSEERALDVKWRSKTRCRAAYAVARCGGGALA